MYFTKSAGTGGQIQTINDFVVDEVQSFPKFHRTNRGVAAISGPYSLCLLRKCNMNTKDAIKFLEKFGDVGYAGLKDKFAVTTQYVTIKGDVKNVKTKNLELTKIGNINKPIQIGDLLGNRFRITLHGCRTENMKKLAKELTVMPNYFGPQRFSRDNHEKGRAVLKRRAKYPKERAKFFIHAYQSFVFNKVLDAYMKKYRRYTFEKFPIPGFNTKFKSRFADKETKKLLTADGIKLSDFQNNEAMLRVDGTERSAFVKVNNLSYTINGTDICLEFELPPGSYATVLISEVTKNPKI